MVKKNKRIKMKTINDYFSKIYCINLDSRPDRYAECLVEFEKNNMIVERVSAIDGGKIFSEGMNYNAGNHGLLLTHIKIIEDAIRNNYKSILILEDDVTFINDSNEKFNRVISSLPNNWDLLYLGGNNQFNQGSFKLITGNTDLVITRENYLTLNYEICRTTWTQCAHAVAINSMFYEFLFDEYNKNPRIPIDMIFCQLQQRGRNVFTFLPSLAHQRPSFSDIENVFVNYNDNHANNF